MRLQLMVRVSVIYAEDASSADVSVSMSDCDFVGSEQAWREKTETNMKEQARYREELLQVKKRKAETASFGEKMRAADMLKDDPSLSSVEALRKAAELMDSISEQCVHCPTTFIC